MILFLRFNLFKLMILVSYVTLCHWQCFISSQLTCYRDGVSLATARPHTCHVPQLPLHSDHVTRSANWTETPGRLRHAVFYEFYITWQSDNGQLRPAYQALFPPPISPPLLDAMCVIPGYHLLLPSHSVQGILSALSRHTCSVRPGHSLATPLPQTVLILSQTHSTLRSDLWQEEATVSERGARGKEQMQNNVGMF